MKMLTQSIVQSICKSIKYGVSNLIRIEGISTPVVYRDICLQLKAKSEICVIPKLSLQKYNEFELKKNIAWQKALADLSQGDNTSAKGAVDYQNDRSYIDWDGSITKWRNAASNTTQKTTLLLLMGTEAIPDKGGLGDFELVSPEKIAAALNGHYGKWFGDVIKANGLDVNDSDAIDAIYKKLFANTNIDLMTLSSFIDSLEGVPFHNYNELIEYICNTLCLFWNCPSIYDSKAIPKKSQLLNDPNRAADIISSAFDFMQDGNTILSAAKEKQLKDRIDTYREKHWINESAPFPESKPIFKTFNAFKYALSEYENGENLEKNRKLFSEMDYAIIYEVVGTKLKKKSPQKGRLKILGEPMPVYAKMVQHVFEESFVEHGDIPEIITVQVVGVTLSNCASDLSSTDNNSDESIKAAYSNICAYMGGILDFMQSAGFTTNSGNNVCMQYDNDCDPFSLSNYSKVSAKIRATGKNGEPCTIDFNVLANNTKYEFRWEFSPYASWKNAFAFLANIYQDNKMQFEVPEYCVCSNMGTYLSCESEEEFFAKVDRMDLENLGNKHDGLVANAFGTDKPILDRYDALMQNFKEWSIQVAENGLFNALDKLRNTVNAYNKLLAYLCEDYKNMTSSQKSLLHLMLNTFIISTSEKTMQTGEETAVIVPAYHPTMLEKIDAQNVFLRNALWEVANGIKNEKALDKEYLENVFRLATITQGPDVIYATVGNTYLPCISSWHYASVYSNVSAVDELVASSNYESVLVADDEDDETWLKKTPESNILSRNIIDYVKTFPARIDGLNLTFVSPSSMQQIVAALYTVSAVFERAGMTGTIFAKIICTDNKKNSASYLKKWLDSYFDREHSIRISTSLKYITNQGTEARDRFTSVLANTDLCFIYNILQTDGVAFDQYEQDADPDKSKFPMTFIPESSSTTAISGSRQINISNRQFRTTELNTQLAHLLGNPQSIEGKYQALSTLRLTEEKDILLDVAHENCRWVVGIDEAIDREILVKSGRSVIGFSTGEGRFGELNVTVSACDAILTDIKRLLERRLMKQFPAWEHQQLTDAASFCVDICRNMDGSKILKALNPYNFEIHSYLAYVLTLQIYGMQEKRNDYITRNLISLDSYLHWFSGGYSDLFSGKRNRPDFMLLEIPKSPENLDPNNDQLNMNITIIECKMGNRNNGYIAHAKEQLELGVSTLANAWTNNVDSVTSRYWFSQLYRTVVFSALNIADNDPSYRIIKEKVYNITYGKFKINWDAQILAFWVDENTDHIASSNIASEKLKEVAGINSLTLMETGQLYIQKMLLPIEKRETTAITYSNECAELEKQAESSKETNTTLDGSMEIESSLPVKPQTDNPTQIDEALISNDEMANDKQSLEGNNKPAIENDASAEPEEHNEDSAEQGTTSNEKNDPLKQESSDEANNKKDLNHVRFLLGEDARTGEKYYWEFGNKELNNRHLLINGNSGCGKTYCIETLLMEAVKQGVSAVVFDYTGGFANSKLDPIFKQEMGDKIVQRIVKQQKIPVNPFAKHDIQIDDDIFVPEEDADVADKIAEIFKSVYSLGDQQRSAIYSAVLNGVKAAGETMSFTAMADELQHSDSSYAKTVMSKIQTFIDFNPFTTEEKFSWGDIRDTDGMVYVIQLAGYGRDIQVLLTEILLWDIWGFCVKSGDETKPFVLVMDEAQNLSHGEKSPSAKILTEGRKFGISGWYATQFMKPQLSDDEIQRLQQAGQKLYFCPPDEGVMTVAKNIDINAQNARDWAERLKSLRKGECVTCGGMVHGNRWSKYEPRIIKVTSLQKRLNNDG
jgi:hypothetical protein